MSQDSTPRHPAPVESQTSVPEIHTEHPPGAPISLASAVAKGWRQQFTDLFPAGQFVRYLCVGGFNTLFGYCTFALTLFLLNHAVPPRFLYLTVVAASLLSTPLNISVAYLGTNFSFFTPRATICANG